MENTPSSVHRYLLQEERGEMPLSRENVHIWKLLGGVGEEEMLALESDSGQVTVTFIVYQTSTVMPSCSVFL